MSSSGDFSETLRGLKYIMYWFTFSGPSLCQSLDCGWKWWTELRTTPEETHPRVSEGRARATFSLSCPPPAHSAPHPADFHLLLLPLFIPSAPTHRGLCQLLPHQRPCPTSPHATAIQASRYPSPPSQDPALFSRSLPLPGNIVGRDSPGRSAPPCTQAWPRGQDESFIDVVTWSHVIGPLGLPYPHASCTLPP